jgi:phosphohistidine phosphatase SixA
MWKTIAILAALAAPGPARAEALSGAALVKALQGGGYVLVMRHAASPQTSPTASEADAGNPNHERQLDETGRTTASAMGQAIKALHLPVGVVWSSPTYRALQTARLAGLPTPQTAPELGDRGASMQATASDQSAWLKAKAAEPPKAGTDTLIITHFPNINAAFGQAAAGIADGEALVFKPGQPEQGPVARIRIEDWPKLAS